MVRAQQLQIDDQQIHLGVADPLADAERGGVHAVDARLDRRQTVDESHAPVTMPVPIDFYALLFDDFLLDEVH